MQYLNHKKLLMFVCEGNSQFFPPVLFRIAKFSFIVLGLHILLIFFLWKIMLPNHNEIPCNWVYRNNQ